MALPSGLGVVAHHTGGQVIGAFHSDEMIGFTLAFAGYRNSRPFLHSHMTAVVPEFRDSGVGRRLKLFQREDALKRGIQLVEWTFDPLELKNAHFNLMRLGAIVRRLIPNCYGITGSPLHAGLPTDRFVPEWWLDSDRVKLIIADKIPPISEGAEYVSIPSNIREIRFSAPADAIEAQSAARDRFQKLFAAGYVVTAIKSSGAFTDYVLEPAKSISGLNLPPYSED